MKRIVLTEEERKHYEIRARELQENAARRKLSGRPRKKMSRAQKERQERQSRRQEKKQQPQCFYETRAWLDLRYRVLRRFGYRCLACGQKAPNVILHVDHIKPRSKHPGLELDENNLQVLCEHCNIGKNNYFEDDLRPK